MRCIQGPNDTSPCALFQRGAECVAACDSNTEYVDRNGRCQSCSSMCSLEGCTGPTARDCSSCKSVNLDGRCIASCPVTHFRNENSMCEQCHPECTSSNGTRFCTGPGPNACLECLHVRRGAECVAACSASDEIALAGVCRSCHPQCSTEGCYGLEATQCHSCQNFLFGDECVQSCDIDTMFRDDGARVCLPCHAQCSLRKGSGGCPSGTGPADCSVCLHVRDNGRCTSECASSFFADTSDTDSALGGVCKPCHPTCNSLQGCVGPNSDQCNSCAQVSFQGQCRSECPARMYLGNGRECLPCNTQCRTGCSGPGPDQCHRESTIPEPSAELLGCINFADISSNGLITCVSTCPSFKYPDSEGICRRCSTLCPLEYGCTGPTFRDCNTCPPLQYLASNRTCQDCHESCSSEPGLKGCIGPGAGDCNTCAGARFNGVCVRDCDSITDVSTNTFVFADTTSNPDEVICRQCNAECLSGGCTGTGPNQCLLGCKNFATIDPETEQVVCIADCGVNTFVTDSPHPRTCHTCHPECRGGCLDATPSSCNSCARFSTEDGECVSECRSGLLPDKNGVCHCPADRSFRNGTGHCLPCNVMCSSGCTGPLATNCKGGSDGCVFAELDGACVADCPTGMIKKGKLCVCRSNHVFLSDECVPCHNECVDGCTGPGPDNCVRCRNFRSGTTCVETCALDEHPNAERFCAPCHPECLGGCLAPGDATQCSECLSFVNQGRCVEQCPRDRFFVDGNVCLEACPPSRPFYNDTRLVQQNEDGVSIVEDEPLSAQLCVSACFRLGPLRNNINPDVPFRCSSQTQASVALSSSDELLSQTSVVIIAVAAGALLIVVIVVFIVLRRQRQKREADFTKQPGLGRTKLNGIYSGRVAPSSRVGAEYASASFYGDDGYLDPHQLTTTGGNDTYMEVVQDNPYSMSDHALFDQTTSSNILSTRM